MPQALSYLLFSGAGVAGGGAAGGAGKSSSSRGEISFLRIKAEGREKLF